MNPRDIKTRFRDIAAAVVVLLILAGAFAAIRLVRAPRPSSGLGREFAYDVSEWTRTDSALMAWREEARFETGFAEVCALAAGSDGRIYVAGDRAVAVFNRHGRPEQRIALDAAPTALAVGSDGLYVALGDRVEAFDLAGRRTSAWPPFGERSLITALALASNVVYAADSGNRQILRCAPDGAVLGRLTGFIVPSPYFDAAIGRDGKLRAANPGRHRIETYSDDGVMIGAWGKASMAIRGFAGCCNPVHIAILPDGGFVTGEKGIPRVKVYTADGVLESVVAGPEALGGDAGAAAGSGDRPAWCDVAATSDGRVLVLASKERAVRIYVRRPPHATRDREGAARE